MKKIILLILMLSLYSCNKPKTVLICGDHVCVNKAEAEQYFQENLSLEVKILNKKNTKDIDLVELNLRSSQDEVRNISLVKKDKVKNKIKSLSDKEIKKKKIEVKEKQKIAKKNKEKKIRKEKIKLKKNKISSKKVEEGKTQNIQKSTKESNVIKFSKQNVNKTNKEIIDICTILEKCSIEEISDYLTKMGRSKNFPDITTRQF